MSIDLKIIELRSKVIYIYFKNKKYDVSFQSITDLVNEYSDYDVIKNLEINERKKMRYYIKKIFGFFST